MTSSFVCQSKLRTNSATTLETALDYYGSSTSTQHETLVDLLTDAMRWCDFVGHEFHIALARAGRHYLAELVDTQTCPRRLSLCQ